MKAIPTLYLSQSLDHLVDCFLHQIKEEAIPPLANRLVLVPDESLKQWLQLEIAKKKGIAMGLKILPLQEALPIFIPAAWIPNALEMTCLLYQSLTHSEDIELAAYLDGKEKRLLDLSDQLTALFFRYGQFGEALFTSAESDWQKKILLSQFSQGPWRLPIQALPEAAPFRSVPVHLFGIDFIPPCYWDYLFRSSSLSLYLFSPCQEFWEDTCTARERRSLVKKQNRKIRPELDAYLRESPSLLANCGKVGRETLKILDRYQFESLEVYSDVDESSLLKKVQSHLLQFKTDEKPSGADASLRILQTGSSRMREIEILRDEIVKTAAAIPYHEISVLAPDIEPYIPLIEFLFSESGYSIPYRILGHDIGKQSSFFQGLSRLLSLSIGRWEVEELMELFETPAFYRKAGWGTEQVEKIGKWISSVRIDWGLDESHRREQLSKIFPTLPANLESGSWQAGLEQLLDQCIYLRPQRIDPDLFEEFLALFFSMKEDLAPFRARTDPLSAWADRLESLAEKYLSPDPEDEADSSALSSLRHLIHGLRGARLEDASFPFSLVLRFLNRPASGQIHGSHLHAVRISSLKEGAALPSKALFLIGMDEDAFPRLRKKSSLDLMAKEKIFHLEAPDEDRYLFLKALFSPSESLCISYGHLSPDEGKPVGPSLLVQELMSFVEGDLVMTPPPAFSSIHSGAKRTLSFWPDWSALPSPLLPVGEITLPISELASFARHPWKHYLQRVEGMYLEEEWSDSFSLQKNRRLREFGEENKRAVDLPKGLIGKTLEMEISATEIEWQKELANWGVEAPFTLVFQENCQKIKREKTSLILPPLEIRWPNLTIRLVGEIRRATEKGLLHIGDEKISGLLKDWPEALITAIALNMPQILFLKSGKIKELNQGESALKAFAEYYLCCRATSSPLLPMWADAFLRNGDLAKEIEEASNTEDPIVEWVLSRAHLPSPDQLYQTWAPFLQKTFASLAALFPTRAKKEEHAPI